MAVNSGSIIQSRSRKLVGSFFFQDLFSPRKFLSFSRGTFFLAYFIIHHLEQAFWNKNSEHRLTPPLEGFLANRPEQPVSPVCLTRPDMSEST